MKHTQFENATRESIVNTNGPTVCLDIQKYEHFLEDQHLSDEQKAEVIEALWVIIVTLIQLGIGIHPLQTVSAELTSLQAPLPKSSVSSVNS